MSKKKNRRQATPPNSTESGGVALSEGVYEIDSGTAELEKDTFHPGAWLLRINDVQSSHVIVGEPRELAFEYMRWIAAGVEHFVGAHLDPERLRVTHLGGGACSMPRYFAATYPRSRHTVVELDGKLADYVREWFDIPRAPTVKIRVGEARAVTESFVDASRDVIIRDVFSGAVTPEPLTTVEFFRHAHRSLAPGGLYVANCGDTRELRGAKAEIAGMTEVFAHVACIADPPMLKGRRYGNVILLASDTPFPGALDPEAAQLTRDLLGGAVPAQYKDEAWTRAFAAGFAPRSDAG
ncbi:MULTISPECIES: spermidine synthase [Micrococcales]|uniref:spermidine synthase n=1 Tax=Micrococcales TaxID=85006 RepID=UPI0004AA50A7|nr:MULTISPECIES: fused MFS/spermidine synthase [Micrococcales]